MGLRRAFPLLVGLVALVVPDAAVGAPGPCQAERPTRIREPRAFIAPAAMGLWKPWSRGGNCIYLVAPGSARVRLVWAARGRAEPRLSARPSAVRCVEPGGTVAVVRTDGSPVKRHVGRAFQYLRDGRLVLQRSGGLRLWDGRRSITLVSNATLRRTAGLPQGVVGLHNHGDRGAGGRPAAVASVSTRTREAVVLVAPNGRLRVALRLPRKGDRFGRVGGVAWAPTGGDLFLHTEREDRTNPYRHTNCLDRWNARSGPVRVFCLDRMPEGGGGHFDELLWAPDGRTALLDNGMVIDRQGRLTGRRLRTPGNSFLTTWSRPR